MDSQGAEIQIDKKHRISFIFGSTAGRDRIFKIITDGIEGQIFLVDQPSLDQNTLIYMGRKPPYICQLLTDFYIISSGICQNGHKNLMQRKSFISAVHDTCGKCMGYHLGKVLQNKTKRIIQGNLTFGKHQPVYCFIIIGDIYAKRRSSKAISRIIKISGFIKSFFVMRILLQAVHNSPGIFSGTQNRIGKIT